MSQRAVGKVLVPLLAVFLVACAGGGLDAAKAKVCDGAPQWSATLQKVAQGDAAPGTLKTEVDELASGLADASQALTDAGATVIAEAASNFGDTITEISTALDGAAPEAADRANEALTRLDNLTTAADCGAATTVTS